MTCNDDEQHEEEISGCRDEKYDEDDDEWYTGDNNDASDDTMCRVGSPTNYLEHLEPFDGNLEEAETAASQVYNPSEARELLSRAKSARGIRPLIGNLESLMAKKRII